MNLFPYQETASKFVQERQRAYIALDMGMGKTLTALHAAEAAGQKNILVVAELNEIANSQNFKREVETHFDSVYLDYRNLREEEMPVWDDVNSAAGEPRHVCGINPDALVKHDAAKIAKSFDAMIVDEATLAKNTSTRRFRQVHKVARAMKYLILLSGTPMLNGAGELYAPMLLMDHPLVAGKGAAGKKAFETIFAGGHRRKIRNTGKFFLDYIWWAGGASRVRELRWLLRDHFFIMSKKETNVFKTKTRTIAPVPMSLPWIAEYLSAWKEYLKEAKKRKVDMENVAELRKLIENGQCYQVNSRWKAKQVAADIAAGKYGDRRIVVFSMFIETDELLQAELKRLGVSYRPFEEVREWKKGTEQVIVGRIKAHGKGANLAEASVALFVDMDFVPSNNIQAENRIDRPEQTRDMLIAYYLTEGDDVIDKHVRNINRVKAQRIEKFMAPLTEEEIAAMPAALQAIRDKWPKESALLGL